MTDAPKVLIVDDHPLFRDALESALAAAFEDGASCVHAASLSDAESHLDQDSFALVLLDLNLGDSSSFDGLIKLKTRANCPPVYVVSATESDAAFAQARSLGAGGYLPKSLPLDDLTAVLVTAIEGGTWFPETTGSEASGGQQAAERIASLTPAQKRVLSHLAAGLLNKQIAFEMDISEATVKAHLTAIFRKLGANNRTQALLAYKAASNVVDHSAA